MAGKRKKLSKGQIRRIKENRSKKLNDKSEVSIDEGQLGEEQQVVVISRFGQHAEIETQDGALIKAQLRRNITSLVTGDKALFRPSTTDEGGIIEAVFPRTSKLTRPDYYDGVKVVAANIDRIFIVSCTEPSFSSQLIDRYLIASEDVEIEPIIIINKADLISSQQAEEIAPILQNYQDLGYPLIQVSAKTGQGIEQLRSLMAESTSIFVGQSGVGKSSLVNALSDHELQLEGEISSTSGLGQHTTTTSKLLHLGQGADVIDSPGVREFGLWHLHPERVTWCYREFRDFVGGCKFRDCKHIKDPGCAIINAVEQQQISADRYANYCRIIQSMSEQKSGRHIKQIDID
ncbi:small ribosomal subunit biogenesis GTPase RsgA [Paraferrimonas sp. SM1919]|uniref:small ribosomal subunit biogenesis GTPase RsgA n=1 Tax=Paraferrimonas sp. SM1919 TaxID=2662263 RepID=UPI0013D175C9|nr:small ribosomal subunit biogenesis GTPase RsgA [Paraferrimonas sp. SM1919]